jgi:hypothetical protein
MHVMTIDLQAAIDNLRSIKGDLEDCFWDHPADSDAERNERFQISFWIRQIGERTAALEAILLHKGAAHILVAGMTPIEQDALQSAANLLQPCVQDGETFADLLRAVKAILSAADRIGLGAAGGHALDGARVQVGP